MLPVLEVVISYISKEVVRRLPWIIMYLAKEVNNREQYVRRLNELSRERKFDEFRYVVLECIVECKEWHQRQLNGLHHMLTEDTIDYYEQVVEELNNKLYDPVAVYLQHKKELVLIKYGPFMTEEQRKEFENE